RWHKLHSKAGKKEKERGEILVSIQFTRHSLTASMFDLSMKDKPRSPFGKLKDKVKGKKKYDLESASAIIPSSMGALDVEDDYELGGKKSKVKGFFLKSKLRKSSLTQSNTSLGSDSTISSASLSLAANVPEVTKSPSRHSSLSTERSGKDQLSSPKLTHKRAFSDDVSQVSPVLEPKAIQNLKPKNDPVSRSSLCINGSHVYSDEPAPKSPISSTSQSSAPLPLPSIPRRQEEGFGFTPLHPDSQEVPWGLSSMERMQQREEPRFIPSPPSLALQEELKVSTRAVTLSNHLGRARMEEQGRLENKPSQAATPLVSSTEPTKDKEPEEMRKEEKKAKGGLFHHGGTKGEVGSKAPGEKVGPSLHTTAGGEERSKTSGWFGSKEPKESPQKPSLEVSPQVETSSDAPSHFPPCSPASFPPAAVAHLASMPSANLPPAPGDSPSGCLSPTNPFLSSLQSNPFFEDLLADQVLNSPSPTHFFSSFLSGPQNLPPLDEKPTVPPPLSEWDDTFDAFATSRLKPELKKENFFASVVAEGMAFIDDPDAASPVEREEGDSNEEEPSSAGTNGWMTIATETAPELPESTQNVAEEEEEAQERRFSPQPALLAHGTLEARAVVAVSPRVLGDVAARGFPVTPEPGREPQGAGSEEETFDIRASVYRLQASMRLEAGEGHLSLSSDGGQRHLVPSPWTEKEEVASGSALPPPKPPRWFAATGGKENDDDDEEEEDVVGTKADVEVLGSSEHFETCPSKFSLDGLSPSGAKESWSQPGSSPLLGGPDGARWEMASKEEPFLEDLSTSGPNPPSKLDLGQAETFWTALEEQEAAGAPQGLDLTAQPQRPPPGQPQGPWRRCHGMDFRKAEFWKPDREEEKHEQDTSSPRNPFAPALIPNTPINPFVEKPPAPLPVQAVLPEKLGHGDSGIAREALGYQGFQPTNLPQPLAFSTPFLVAATNPPEFDFPSPLA
ncbi:RFIP5 protein, partial [Oreotrochilus melanogaster]|nr:RFIP5 protein [Oreotrochilus melanogaster]